MFKLRFLYFEMLKGDFRSWNALFAYCYRFPGGKAFGNHEEFWNPRRMFRFDVGRRWILAACFSVLRMDSGQLWVFNRVNRLIFQRQGPLGLSCLGESHFNLLSPNLLYRKTFPWLFRPDLAQTQGNPRQWTRDTTWPARTSAAKIL